MQVHQFVSLIHQSFKNQNNKARKLAQKQLLQERIINANNFFTICSSIFSDQNQSIFIRQSASTLITSSICFKLDNCHSTLLWDSLAIQVKQKLKSDLLNSLIDSNSIIVKSGANAISHIAALEIPRNEWIDLVDSLTQNAANSQLNIRKASIITIGNICEQLNYCSANIDNYTCKQFLAAILMGLQEKDDMSIVQVSILSLRNSLVFLKPILNELSYRDQIFNILYDRIKRDAERVSYEALFQFVHSCYDYLDPYIKVLSQIIIIHIKERNQNSILALEFLDTIGQQYVDRAAEKQNRVYRQKKSIENYLTQLEQQVLPQALNCLIIQNQKDQEFPELRNSAAKVLSSFVQIGDLETVKNIADGIDVCLSCKQPGYQQATAIILSVLCVSKYTYEAQNYIRSYFDQIINLMTSNEEIVRINTLNGLVTIAEFFPDLFHKHKRFHQILQTFITLLKQNVEVYTTLTLLILKNLSEDLSQESEILANPSLFFTKFMIFFQNYIDNYTGANKQHAYKAASIIINCVLKLQNIFQLQLTIEFLINKYHFCFEKGGDDLEIRLSIILAVIRANILSLQVITPKVDLINQINRLMEIHIKSYGVDVEIIELISSSVISFHQSFTSKASYYWQILLQGSNLVDQSKIFKVVLSCIGDYSRVYGENFLPQILDMLDRLLDVLHQMSDKQLKLCVISCVTDLILGLGLSAESFVKRILKVFDSQFSNVYNLLESPHDKQYVDSLKNNLIDMYSCLVFSINEKKTKAKNRTILQHFPIMATFVIKTCEINQNPTIDYLKDSLFLIFDVAKFYQTESQITKKEIQNIIQADPIKQLVNVITNYQSRDGVNQLITLISKRYNSQ